MRNQFCLLTVPTASSVFTMIKTFRKVQVRFRLINLKVTNDEYERIKIMAEKYTDGNVSAWLRAAGMSEPNEFTKFDQADRDDETDNS